MSVPESYRTQSWARAHGFVWGKIGTWPPSSFRAEDTLHGWAARQADARILRGRGVALAIDAPAPGPDERREWVVRHYYRGGAARGLGDRYLRFGRPRPFVELDASVAARVRGIRTPAVVAGAVYGAGIFYRADLITERVPNAEELAELVLKRDSLAEGYLRAAGRLVRGLEASGIAHADLNARNILLDPATDPPQPWVIDLDRCQVLPEPSAPSRSTESALLARLERSLAKLSAAGGQPLAPSEHAALRDGYEAAG